MSADLSVTRTWPWGLALVVDPGSNDDLPTSMDGANVVALSSGLVCAVRHEVEGAATVTVRVDSVLPDDLVLDFAGSVVLLTGELAISDIERTECRTIAVAPGPYRAVVITDEPNEPTSVQIWLQHIG